MDALITAAARALSAGDPLTALKRVALRDDAPALALRGIAMAQLGDLDRARDLLRRAAGKFGAREPIARARCQLAQGEIALVRRDLGKPVAAIALARAVLQAHGDRPNAAHAGYLDARRALLLGALDDADDLLDSIEMDALPPASRVGYWLVAAGTAMRRVQAAQADACVERAAEAAAAARIPALAVEVETAKAALRGPAARLVTRSGENLLRLGDVETLFAGGTLIVDACRQSARKGGLTTRLSGRPVLFALLRALGEAYPEDVSREDLLFRAFRAREADESHRARLRVEIGRLRRALAPLASVTATRDGFVLDPLGTRDVAMLAPPVEDSHQDVLALLADGEAWSSSALALVLDVSPRTIQRALETLARDGKVESFGRGRACRWIAPGIPGFPTSLLLPAAPPNQLG